MRDLLGRPAEEGLAQLLEEGVQPSDGAALDEDGLLLALDLEVDQRDLHLEQVELGAEEGAVHLCLRPVQGPMVGGNSFELTAKGFDLFEQSGF